MTGTMSTFPPDHGTRAAPGGGIGLACGGEVSVESMAPGTVREAPGRCRSLACDGFAESTIGPEHGGWWRGGARSANELSIELTVFAVSAGLLRWTWRHDTTLLAAHVQGPDGQA
jgi:hypothetical protein